MKAFLLLVVACVFVVPPKGASAQTTNAMGDSVPHQYLIAVDISFSMAREKPAILRAVSELLLHGLNGKMQPGDTLQLWTFNEQINPRRLPLQVWLPDGRQVLAERATQFLKNQKYERRTNMHKVMAEVMDLVRDSKALTVIIITDGDTPISGTPFDRSINLRFTESGRELRKAKTPFVTVLVASEGRFVAWNVNPGDQRIRIPEPTDRLATNVPSMKKPIEAISRTILSSEPDVQRTTPLAISKGLTNIQPTTNSFVEPTTSVPATQSLMSIARSTTERAATKPTETPAKSAVAEPSRDSRQVTNNIVTPASDHSKHRAAPETQPAGTSTEQAVAATTSPPAVPAQSSFRTSDSKPPVDQTQTRHEIHPADGPSTPPMAGAAVTPDTGEDVNRNGYLVAGFLLIVTAAGLLFWYGRNSRPSARPSLISRSLESKKSPTENSLH